MLQFFSRKPNEINTLHLVRPRHDKAGQGSAHAHTRPRSLTHAHVHLSHPRKSHTHAHARSRTPTRTRSRITRPFISTLSRPFHTLQNFFQESYTRQSHCGTVTFAKSLSQTLPRSNLFSNYRLHYRRRYGTKRHRRDTGPRRNIQIRVAKWKSSREWN